MSDPVVKTVVINWARISELEQKAREYRQMASDAACKGEVSVASMYQGYVSQYESEASSLRNGG
jgi:flagellar biosynthesis chaperone FliJ